MILSGKIEVRPIPLAHRRWHVLPCTSLRFEPSLAHTASVGAFQSIHVINHCRLSEHS